MPGDVTELLCRLVEIDSVNPSLVVGGPGEAAMASFIADWAGAAGLEVERLEATAGRPTVLVRAPGAGGGGTLLLCAHTDTVTVEDMPDAHRPRIDGDRLHGRGAYDMKAGLAAALIACREAAALGLAGDVVVAAVADEEHASIGVKEALLVVRADAAIVTEPTELAVAIAHKGFVWAELEVAGRAAHGSRPARCVIELERRTLPGESAAQVSAEIDTLLAGCRDADPELVVEHRPGLVREPFEVRADEPVVRAVTEAAAEALGREPEVGGVSYWADSAFIAAAGVPTVLLGPSGAGAHSPGEWVSLSATETTTRALIGAARRICG